MSIKHYPNTARLVNRFKLGGDPEFVMADPWGRYVHAETLGMNTLQSFGCDMAGRQAELRAYPSRFALEVVASMLDSLRWMGHVYPASLNNNWNAVTYNGKDGCGGHVHFGRRRPNREKDIEVLDKVNSYLVRAGIFDVKGYCDRMERTHYGRSGDFRVQGHGYEYRTFPTQLSSPWLTYLTLVVSKLAVFTGTPPIAGAPKATIVELLKRFEDLDDDAAIVLQAIQMLGMPCQTNTDFKRNWGVSLYPSLVETDFSRFFFPSMNKPRQETNEDLFNLFINGAELPVRAPVPTWEPFALPQGVQKIRVQAHTLGHAPDIAMNLLSRFVSVGIYVGDRWTIASPIKLPRDAISRAIRQDIRFLEDKTYSELSLYIPAGANKSLTECRRIKSILSNIELFPVVRANELATADWSRWDSLGVEKPKAKKAKLGRIVAHVTRQEPEHVAQEEGEF